MVLKTAAPGTPIPHPGNLLRTTVHWNLHQPLVSSFMSEPCLLHRVGLPSVVSVHAIPFPCRHSFAFFQSGSYFASFCCISNSLPVPLCFLFSQVLKSFSNLDPLRFTLVPIPTFRDAHLHLAHAAVRPRPPPPYTRSLGG